MPTRSLTIRLDLGDESKVNMTQHGPAPDPMATTHTLATAGQVPTPGSVDVGAGTAVADSPPVPSPDVPGLVGSGAAGGGASQGLPRPEGEPSSAASSGGGSQDVPQPQGEPVAKKRSAPAKKNDGK